MVETAEHRSSNDPAFESADAWNGLLLSEGLMRARVIVQSHVRLPTGTS
jgi:hypothetical protein